MVALVGVLVVELKHTYQDERGLFPNYDLPLKVLARDPTDRLSSFASYYANPLKGQAHYSTSGEGTTASMHCRYEQPSEACPYT